MRSKYFSTSYSDRPMNKADIVRELVYLKADLMLPGRSLVVGKPIEQIDFAYDIPKITTIAPEKVEEGSRSQRKRLEFWQKPVSLDKYQTSVEMTYESKIRSKGKMYLETTTQAVAVGMAQAMNNEILSTLVAATGQVSTAAAKWNVSAASPAQDVATIVGGIFDNTNIEETDLTGIRLVVPAKVWSFLKMPKDTGLLYMTIKGWMEKEQQVAITPSRYLGTAPYNGALVVLPGEQTAHFLEYTGADFPTAVTNTIPAVGDEYIITRFYKTVAIPDTVGGTTSSRLGWISNIC